MKNIVQTLFVSMALILLAGCNSEDAFNSESQLPNVDATLVEITVTPSLVSMLEGRTLQLVAMAKYDDGGEMDVSHSVTWNIVGDPTIAQVSASGLLTGNAQGNTELTATKEGIISNTVNVEVCTLADACIDIFDTGGGKLFTNSPSVAYLNSIGGSATNGTYTEAGDYGPSGDFYTFDHANAKILCDTYSSQSIGNRTNWRLATIIELTEELFDIFGNMFTARDWPTEIPYWAWQDYSTDVRDALDVQLGNGGVSDASLDIQNYASCVSEP